MTRADVERIIDHCRREYPNEACGILAGAEGMVEKVYCMTNANPGPASYEMDPGEQFRVMKEIRQAGFTIAGIYHSHPQGAACPSAIDVERAYWPGTLFPNHPEAVHVIVSLADRSEPVVRGFTIIDGTVLDAALQIS